MNIFKSKFKVFLKYSIFPFFFALILSSCNAIKPKKVDTSVPMSGEERARKNINEGRGVTLGGIRNSKTTYEFSTSNPLWRATLDTLDFLPLSVVDYSGGVIVSDWYSSSKNESIKITIRFLSNEIQTNSIRAIVHKKKCSVDMNCEVESIKSQIQNEIITSIIKKAAILEKEAKK